jgi:hypothetical protein
MSPNETAEINVPAKAKVKIVPMLRKKLACHTVQHIPHVLHVQLFLHALTWCNS